MSNLTTKPIPTIEDYRIDINQYWTRLMWYRDELWRVTTPIFTAYGAFIVAMFSYLFATESSIDAPKIINMLILVLGVTFVLIRLYFIYSTRIYAAIKYLNHEIEIREQRLYKKFEFYPDLEDQENFSSNYKTFKVFPELHMLFGIIFIVLSSILFLMLISMLPSMNEWNFDIKNLFLIFFIGVLVGGFELYIKAYTWACDFASKNNQKSNGETKQ